MTDPQDIPANFPDIQKMMALSDIMRDYEKGKITNGELAARLREIESDRESVARVYERLTGERYGQ